MGCTCTCSHPTPLPRPPSNTNAQTCATLRGMRVVYYTSRGTQRMETTVLHTYLRWCGVALLAGLVAMLLVGLGLYLGWQVTPRHLFETARTNWATEPLQRYRLIIERPSLRCQQDVIVQDEEIVEVLADNCPIELLTMTELYDRIARLDGLSSGSQSPPGICGCEWQLRAEIRYAPDLRYPVQVAVSDQRVIDWAEEACWEHLLIYHELPACEVPLQGSAPRITNVVLIPLIPMP